MSEDCRKSLVDIVVRLASGALSDPGASADEQAAAYECLLGISLTEQLVGHASVRKMSQMVKGGRANPWTQPQAKLLRSDIHAACFSVDAVAPAGEKRWRESVEGRGLTREAPREGREDVLAQLRDWLISSPEDSQGARWDVAGDALKGVAHRRLALKLRLAAQAECVAIVGNRHRELLLAEIHPTKASVMADSLVGESTQVTEFVRASKQTAERLGMSPGEGGSGGAKMARAAERAACAEQMQKFQAVCERTNIPKSCDLSLKCVVAGVRRRGTFYDLRGRPRVPPTEEAVLAWSAYFSAGWTFQQYLPHLETARFFLGRDLS